MIHKNDVDEDMTDEKYVRALANLIIERGLTMDLDSVMSFITRNIAVQSAYNLVEYKIQPLPNPETIKSVYFRNGGGKFYGFLEAYFLTESTNFALDDVNYWQEWQREMPCLNIIDVESSSHMSIMYEELPKKLIRNCCEELYQQAVVTH